MLKKICLTLLLCSTLGITGCTKQTAEKPAKTSTVSLKDPEKKEQAMALVSSAENSSLDWKAQYNYIEDIQDGRGYTAGIIGFCSGTGDMLDLVEKYTKTQPENPLAAYLPALKTVNGSDSHSGLDPDFTSAWKKASKEPEFQKAQNQIRDEQYFDPAVKQAKKDGLSVLGQFIYYDAIVMHGPGDGSVPYEECFYGIRKAALKKVKSPAEGGDETEYLTSFLDARDKVMALEDVHEDLSRTIAQRKFLKEENFTMKQPLHWVMYGEKFKL